MGNGASLLKAVVAEHPELLGKYREEVAVHFTEQFTRLQALGLSDEEIKQEFIQSLRDGESDIFARVAESESKEQNEVSSSTTGHAGRSVQSVAVRFGINYMCCVDGSDASELAFRVCMCLRKKHDNVEIFHAFKEKKHDSLLPEYLPEAIRSRYDDLLEDSSISSKHHSFHFEERYTRSACRAMQDYLEHYEDQTSSHLLPQHRMAPDFVVLGHAGRHKVAGGKHGGGETSLGSTADLALRSVHVPCIIAKRCCPHPGSTKVFMLTVNFSECSKRGLDVLLRLVGPRDSLRVVFVQRPETDPEKIQNMQNYYENELHQYGPFDSRFSRLRIDHHQSVASAIIDHANGPHSPDFLVLAPRSHPNRVHSLVTEEIIVKARPSIILCKN